ncbi:carbohydrate ABC transporter permease [Microbacterium aurantiacum]|uniref:carbohydrate ABC transporter permease n=2 Tax=Microbacterium aurantiacum TaxID=162393 RepID=UPI004036BF96
MSMKTYSPARAVTTPQGEGREARTRRSTALKSVFGSSAYLLPAAIVLAALSIYPLIELVRMSLSDVGPGNLIGEWDFVGLANIVEVLNDDGFWLAVRVTAQFTMVILVSNLLLGYFFAVVLSRGGRLADTALSIMVLVWALPPLVSGSVWKFLLAGDGAVNAILTSVGLAPVTWLSSIDLAMWSVSLVAAWASLPFAVLIIRGGLMGVPREVMEAAAIDGAGGLQMHARIVVPMIRSTLVVLVTLSILYAFRSFDFVYVMTAGGPGTTTATLPYAAYQTAFRTYSFGAGAAIAVLSMIVVVILAVPYILGVRKEAQAA